MVGLVTMEKQYFTVKEVAERLRVTRQAIYNWIESGRLAAVKVGRSTRIPESALDAFIEPYTPGEQITDDSDESEAQE